MRSEPAYYLGSQYVNFLINHVFYSFAAAFYTWILWVTVIILLQYKLWTKKLFATDVKCEQTVTDSHPDFDSIRASPVYYPLLGSFQHDIHNIS